MEREGCVWVEGFYRFLELGKERRMIDVLVDFGESEYVKVVVGESL